MIICMYAVYGICVQMQMYRMFLYDCFPLNSTERGLCIMLISTKITIVYKVISEYKMSPNQCHRMQFTVDTYKVIS